MVTVYDITGQTVFNMASGLWSLASGVSWNASALPSGTYIIQADLKGKSYRKAVSLVK
jgi:hypothetical protein